MWIMLIKKLATQVSPPKLSIFWSTPLGDHKFADQQIRDFIEQEAWHDYGFTYADKFENDENGKRLSDELLWEKAKAFLSTQTYGYDATPTPWGNEQNWVGARQIIYKDQQLTVFPDEFSVMKRENMAMYVFGLEDEPPSHELVAGTVAEKEIALDILDGPRKEMYDAAMTDGASKEQAYAMALGIDISSDTFTADIPPTGWYRCKHEYALVWCDESELAE